jgi:hypothetical protein
MNSHEPRRPYKAVILLGRCQPTLGSILASLFCGEMRLGKRCEVVGITQSNASRQLLVSRNKRIVDAHQNVRLNYYLPRVLPLGEIMVETRCAFFAHATNGMNLLAIERARVTPLYLELHA